MNNVVFQNEIAITILIAKSNEYHSDTIAKHLQTQNKTNLAEKKERGKKIYIIKEKNIHREY